MTFLNFSLPDFLAIMFLFGFSVWSLRRLFIQIEDENIHLRRRNAVLASWLQMAELQTGVPYYSSVATDAVSHEYSASFMQVVQNRVKTLPYAKVFTPVLRARDSS